MQIGLGIGIPFTRSQIWLAVQEYSPSDLFQDGTQGLWLDPSDMSTMFQDAAGTTPVTAVEQPVGLMLDKSKGLVLGPELVTNGDFSSGTTGWSGQANVTISTENGELKGVTSTTASTYTYQDEITVSGRWYKATATVRSISGKVRFSAWNAAFLTQLAYVDVTTTTNSQLTLYFLATGASTRIAVGLDASPASTYYADNISVRELPGNHAYQTVSTKRAVLSARYNLLTKTEQFDDAGWVKVAGGVSIAPNTALSPIGTMTADKLIGMAASGTKELFSPVAAVTGFVSYTASVAAKAAEYSWVYIACNVNGTLDGTFFNLATGQIGNTVGSGSVPAISPLGDGWYRVSVTRTATYNGGYVEIFPAIANGTVVPQFTGDNASGIYIWGASLVPVDQASLPYQRVNTATDYDTQGFQTYLKFDGVDDSMRTNNIDFTATDKMTVFAGVRKLSDVSRAIVTELSASPSTNFFNLEASGPSAGANYGSLLAGSAVTSVSGTTFTSPTTNVVTIQYDISQATRNTELLMRVNGAIPTLTYANASDAGTGNFGNYPLYIGARAGTSLFFNGHLYQLVIAGKQASPAEITDTEKYVNSKTLAY